MKARTKTLKRKSKVRRQRDPIPWKYCFLTLVCGLLLVGGFFYAARQHFSSMDYGMKNATLRKQLDEIKSEKRRLLLSKEIALSHESIKKAAKKLGLTAMTARNIEVFDYSKTKENADQKSESEKAVKSYDIKFTDKKSENVKTQQPKNEPENKIVEKVNKKSDSKSKTTDSAKINKNGTKKKN